MALVGFGSARITPSLPVTLAGFGDRKGPVDAIHDDLEVHAVVITDVGSGDTLCLLVLDLLMIAKDVAEPLRDEVAEALGIPFENVLPTCTHTHSGPSASKRSRLIGWPMQQDYPEVLIEGCVRAARMAAAFLEEGEFHFARSALPAGLAVNRRGHAFAPSFSVIDVRRPGGGRIGTIGNVAIHPVAASWTARAVSRDWPGVGRDTASRVLDAPVVMVSGAIGDVNPARDPHTDPEPGGNWDYMGELGRAVGSAVADLAQRAEPIGTGARSVANRVHRFRAGLTVPAVLSGDALRRTEVELVEWELGKAGPQAVRIVSMPGEFFHARGVAIESSRNDRAILAGLSPWWQGYHPCPYTSGYEEKMSYGRRFVERVGALLTQRPDR